MNDALPLRPAPGPVPWYRCVWPWALMAGPAFVVVGGACATWLAASTSDGLVVDDYYKRGMAINRTLARSEYGTRIGLSAQVRIDAAGDVRVTLAQAVPGAPLPAEVRLTFAHPTRAGQDRSATLVRSAGDTYIGHVEPPGAGRRHVIVETELWRLSGDATLGAATELTLAAPPPAG